MSNQDREEEAPLSESPLSGPASDRRTAFRHTAVFPAHIDTGNGHKRTAVIRDLSVSGALVLTRARVKIGDEVTLSLYLTGDPNHSRDVKGRVVRDERRSVEVSDIWPYAVAIHFNEPFEDIEPDVKALAEKQASLGLIGGKDP
ncbi:PilZ domain-containing protein [Polyangium jinanense]|uniref:PilZ domain-containing protein n=1 Tax=Polyangium jinanense TaxID=2829994 RepID=A0A9X4AWV0_9BACT|nr:PilZ domain-containing protein [Polyangium jinanense]MDC3956562.1 PilZ domain-containing protein [Polyangium jinanense]MDC3985655.1 PilZ domain-containing protein [Polyangium jinanense]